MNIIAQIEAPEYAAKVNQFLYTNINNCFYYYNFRFGLGSDGKLYCKIHYSYMSEKNDTMITDWYIWEKNNRDFPKMSLPLMEKIVNHFAPFKKLLVLA